MADLWEFTAKMLCCMFESVPNKMLKNTLAIYTNTNVA